MPIPNPDLDNKLFVEIVEEVKKKTVTYSPLWTDHNASDPGITLLELFGWLAETQLYSLNRIRQKNYRKFLQLLDVRPSKAAPAEMVAKITPSNVAQIIKQGSLLESIASSDQRVIFEVLEDTYVAPITIEMTGTFSQIGFRDNTVALENTDAYFYAFGEKPRVGNCFYIGLSTEKGFKMQDLSKVDPISFYINLYSDSTIVQRTHDEEEPRVTISNRLRWEGYKRANGEGKWVELNVKYDGTLSLTRSGKVSLILDFAEDDKSEVTGFDFKFYWIRCKLIENHYEISPQISALLSNTVYGVNGRSIVNEPRLSDKLRVVDKYVIEQLEESEGLPDQIFKLYESISEVMNVKVQFQSPDAFAEENKKIKPEYLQEGFMKEEETRRVLYFLNNAKSPEEIDDLIEFPHERDISLRLGVRILEARNRIGRFRSLSDIENIRQIGDERFDEVMRSLKSKEIPWQVVDDFDASGPDDHHYVVDMFEKSIKFGNGVNGRIPPGDTLVSITYKFGKIEDLYVKAKTPFQVLDKEGKVIDVGLSAENPFPSTRGKKAETSDDARIRARKNMKIPFKAVSSSDFEHISINTPGLRVARAKAFALDKDRENTVHVVVVPESNSKNPAPGRGFLDSVCEHLDRHRILTTRLEVTGPDYIGISIDATVTIQPRGDPVLTRQRIIDALDTFLAPIARKRDQKAWEFGRSVFKSEVYEVIEGVDGVDCVIDLSLSASGRAGAFEYNNGNVIIRNLGLVYLDRYSITVSIPESRCREKNDDDEQNKRRRT
jgi:hypothetical protein